MNAVGRRGQHTTSREERGPDGVRGGDRRPGPGRLLVAATTGLLLAVSLLLGPSAVAHAEGEVGEITRYDVTVQIDADGTSTVAVDLDYDFGTEEAHGPRFVQPVRQAIEDDPDRWRSLPIDDVTASSPSGAPADVSTETEGGAMQILIGDEDVEVTGRQSYRVSWVQQGLINPEAAGSGMDELAWNVIGTDWEVPIGDISVTVSGAGAVQRTACFAGDPEDQTPCAADGSDGTTATFAQDQIEPGQGLTVVTGWPGGTYDTALLTTERQHLGNTFTPTPLTIGTGALLALLGSAAAVVLARRGRDERYAGLTPGLSPAAGQVATTTTAGGGGPVAVRFSPPEGAGPAQLGTVLDEVVHTHDVTAGIVDLAVRGQLRIIEVGADDDGDADSTAAPPPAKPDQTPRWRLERRDDAPTDELAGHEQLLLDGLFGGRGSVRLDQLEFAPVMAATQNALYTEVTEHGWFRADPRAVRNRWYGVGVALIVAGTALALVLAFTLGWGIAGLGLVVAGVVTMFCARRAPARTAAGSALLDQALGFKLYLETAEADQIKVEEAAAVFSRYLPYAIAFGVAEHWAGVFAELAARGHQIADPGWYVGAYPMAFASPAFGDQLSSFTGAVTTSVTAATATSGGASGFSAGVGGGVGGGGGGSW